MIELRTYTEEELAKILGVKKNTLRRTHPRHLKNYKYKRFKIKKGVFAYKIIDYKGEQKSEFIQLCEKVAECSVEFPNEKTAEKLLKVLFEEDCSILSNEEIGFKVGLEKHTVGKYINLFRKYEILPPKKESVNNETGEVYDLNDYRFYLVSRKYDFKEEIDEEEFKEIVEFRKNKYSEYLSFFIEGIDSIADKNKKIKVIEKLKQDAKDFSYYDCIENFGGIPKKALSKVPTKKAQEVFKNYFKNKLTS
jgi:predicted house-cleaning noncanonical NTP pyrophosphatase (MazG superfamily)